LENDGEASKSIRVGKFIPLSQVVRFIPSPLGPFRSAEFFGGRSEQLMTFHDSLFRRGGIKVVFKDSLQIDRFIKASSWVPAAPETRISVLISSQFMQRKFLRLD
jgi:hypothetical protein